MKVLKTMVEVTATMPDDMTEEKAVGIAQSLLNMINKSYSDGGCKVRVSPIKDYSMGGVAINE